MSISSDAQRKAGPYACNGATVAFPFLFKVFQASDLEVSLTDAAGNVSVLALTTDYTVTLNADQDNNPGGTVTTVAAHESGTYLTLTSQVPETQPVVLTNAGGFYPKVVNDALDRATIQIQQLREQLSRSIVGAVSDSTSSLSLPAAAARAGKVLAFDTNGDLALSVTLPAGSVSIPVGISQGGTAATTQSQAIKNLGLIDMKSEVAITGTTVLDSSSYGKGYVLGDSGSPVNYTVTLPTGAPTGTLIMVRISSTATKLYTISGADVGIDGIASRVMWRGESAMLLREATNWTKIGGRTINFCGVLQKQSTQSISSGTSWQKATLDHEVGDTTFLNLCFDSANNRFKAPRVGNYSFTGYLSIAASVSVSNATAQLSLSVSGAGSPTAIPCTLVGLPFVVGDTRSLLNATGMAIPLSAGDYVELLGRIYGGTIASPTFEYAASTLISSLSYAEEPQW